jgi:hypothetical protein
VDAFVIMVHLKVEKMYFGVLIRVILLVAYFAEISIIHVAVGDENNCFKIIQKYS